MISIYMWQDEPVRTSRSKLLPALAVWGMVAFTTSSKAQTLDWATSIGSEGDELAAAIAVDAVGNVVTAGYFDGVVDMDPGPGEHLLTSNGMNDVFVQKLTANGELIWAFQIGDFGADYAKDISIDPAGNIYVTGTFNGVVDLDPGPLVNELTSPGDYGIFIAKYLPGGELVWARGFGGTGYKEPASIEVAPTGNVYLLSFFSGTLDADPGVDVLTITSQGGQDILLQKFNEQGDLVWAQATGSGNTELGLAMALDAEENIWFTGAFEGTLDFDPGAGDLLLTSAGAWDIFVTKRSTAGEVLFAGRMGGLENFDTGYDIAIDPMGNAIVAGSFFGSGDFDPGEGVHTLTASSMGSDEVFVLKLDPTGAFVWAVSIGGSDGDLGYGVAVMDQGQIAVTGFFSGTADFDPDPVGSAMMTTSSMDNFFDSFVCLLTPDGVLIDAWQFGGANSIATQSIAHGGDNALYVAGHFESAPDFDPGTAEVTLVSAGFRDAFVVRFDDLSTGIPQENTDLELGLYPNPASDHLLIEVAPSLSGSSYTIYDAQGRAVRHGLLQGTRNYLPLNGLAEGRYELRLDDRGSKSTSFILVQ